MNEPLSWSDSGRRAGDPDASDGHDTPEAAPIVTLFDPNHARLHVVSEIVSECGAQPFWVESAAAIQNASGASPCSIAVVALGRAFPSDETSLAVIRTLKQKGFTILSHAPGTRAWPLRLRCRPLLAGALQLLDSDRPEFGSHLRSVLAQLLRARASQWREEEELRALMTRLGMVGKSPMMISVYRWIVRTSPLSDLPALITGETGTGKQLLASALHQLDPKRRHGPFIAVNCGAISPTLAESELFGHRRGAFTGADQERRGLIRSAEGGVLFLDEIGELDSALQTKLLRVLEESRVLGVGEDREVPVSIRVISATNRDLDAMVRQRAFRADLFHRLNVLPLRMPALRERPEDVRALVEHFLKKHRRLNPTGARSASREFVDALTEVDLPGNVRQLENLVRRALLNKEDDSPLTLSDLPPEVWRQLAGEETAAEGRPRHPTEDQESSPPVSAALRAGFPASLVELLETNGWSLARSLRDFERSLVEAALTMAHGNQSQTARFLGITARSVHNKLKKHRLHRSPAQTG
jgi:two-component system nitrogen regulation response regulator GlnG